MRLIKIVDQPSRPKSAEPNALEMLLGCHERIRHFMLLSQNMARVVESVPARQVAETAGAIYRYFAQALPLHEADENETLFPRFQTAFENGNLVREAAETMVEQHKAIDELVADLLNICHGLMNHPESLPSVAMRLEDVAGALDKIFGAHLHLEETVIFPAAMEALTPEQLEEMAQEMKARRQPPVLKLQLVN